MFASPGFAQSHNSLPTRAGCQAKSQTQQCTGCALATAELCQDGHTGQSAQLLHPLPGSTRAMQNEPQENGSNSALGLPEAAGTVGTALLGSVAPALHRGQSTVGLSTAGTARLWWGGCLLWLPPSHTWQGLWDAADATASAQLQPALGLRGGLLAASVRGAEPLALQGASVAATLPSRGTAEQHPAGAAPDKGCQKPPPTAGRGALNSES